MRPTIPAHLGLVVVRYLASLDHAAYIALERDADVRKFVRGPARKSDEEFLRALRSYEPTTELLAIADPCTDAFLGRCGLLSGEKEREVFLLLSMSAQGRGIGRCVLHFLIELASSIGCVAIGIVHPENMASRTICEKVGMVHAGTNMSADYQNGHLRYVVKGSSPLVCRPG